jgi:N6-adenosine-specific RNA methylase IME4
VPDLPEIIHGRVGGMNPPDGPFDLIYADPPLHFATWSDKGQGRSPSRHYATMTMPQLCELPIAQLAARDSVLVLWVYGPRLPDTLALIEAWGFKFRSIGLVWVKTTQAGRVHFGTGFYTRKASEILLLATRGKGLRRYDRAVSGTSSCRRAASTAGNPMRQLGRWNGCSARCAGSSCLPELCALDGKPGAIRCRTA